ncbi:MAG TPA: hypothetical protein VL371_12415, partial [Gemmataceae bacterium]|nr:hypothetical protein [Gemmataceae bacterium]
MNRLKNLAAVTLTATLSAIAIAAETAPPPLVEVGAPSQRSAPTLYNLPPAGRVGSSSNCYWPPVIQCPTPPTVPSQPSAPTPEQPAAPAPTEAPFSFAPESSALALSGGSASIGLPNMAGSFSGVSFLTTTTTTQTVTTPFIVQTGRQRTIVSNPVTVPIDYVTALRVFDASRGTALIGENESPRPQTRFYTRYQYFQGVPSGAIAPTVTVIDDAALQSAVLAELAAQNQASIAAGTGPIITNPANAIAQVQRTVSGAVNPAAVDAASRQAANRAIHREVLGFETAFFNNVASIGLRVPMFQQQGDGSLGRDDFGDLTAIFKAVIWDDTASGDLLSGGLAVTAPTGPGIQTVDGTIRSTLFQPFIGAIRPFTSRLAMQGFWGIVVPTDSRDVTFLTSDVGLYYTLYRATAPGACLTAVIPALEAHAYNPVNHR